MGSSAPCRKLERSDLQLNQSQPTSEYTVDVPIFGWKAAKAQPRGPTRPAGHPPPTDPLTGQARTDMFNKGFLIYTIENNSLRPAPN